MLEEIARLFLCFAAGDVLARIGVLPCPGSVCGLVLLYLDLLVLGRPGSRCRRGLRDPPPRGRGRVPAALGTLADNVLGFLGMLFVPAGVGVLAYLDLFRTQAIPIAAAVLGGTVVTLGTTAIAADRIARAQDRGCRAPKVSDVAA